MSQQALFELQPTATKPSASPGRESETEKATSSRIGDERRIRRLSTIADKLQRAIDPLDRAKLASEARQIAEALVEETILEANRAGVTWRELGTGLDIPFQTLYRRYGGG